MSIFRNMKPRLADVQCSRITFQPGDRILVRSFHKLDPSEEKRLRKAIRKWAGCEVEVLIYDATKMEITIDHSHLKMVKP